MKTFHLAFILFLSIQIISCDEKNTQTMKEIKRDNAVINYNISGSGDTTLLFVHGSYIDQSYWDDQVKFFSPQYKVVTMDLPGHGKSGRERTKWTVNGFADDVIALIKELNLKNVILIGHSLAGDINLIAATKYPDPLIGFIAVDFFKNAATPLPPEYQEQAKAILEKIKTDFENTNEEYARMVLLTPQTPQAITNLVVNAYRSAYKPMGQQTMPQIFEMHQTEKELLPKLKFKLYLINVDYMPTNEEPLKQHVGSGYELIQMKGTSHYPMIEDPAEFNRLLEQTINKIVADKSIIMR